MTQTSNPPMVGDRGSEDRLSLSQPISNAPSTRAILPIFWQRRWVLLACVLLALVGGFVYLSKAKRIYRSSSKIYVQKGGTSIYQSSMNPLGAFMAFPFGYLHGQAELIKSTAILSAALELPSAEQASSIQGKNAIGFLKSALSVKLGKESGDIITVVMQSPHARDNAILVNSVVEAYINHQDKVTKSTAAEVLRILQQEKQKREVELRETWIAMVDFQRKHGTLSFESAQGNIVNFRLGHLSQTLTRAELETMTAKIAMQEGQALTEDALQRKELIANALASAEGDPWFDENKILVRFRQLQAKAALVPDNAKPNHPDVRRVQKELENLRPKIAQIKAEIKKTVLANYRERLRQAWLASKVKEEKLRNAYEAQRELAHGLNAQAVEYNQMQSIARRAESALDLLDTRIKELNVTEDPGALSISILETASPGGAPIQPNPTRITVLALGIGLMAGVGAAFLLDWMDHRFRSVEEVMACLDLPVLGVVPHLLSDTQGAERGQLVHLNSTSAAAEAYRTIRTAIYFGAGESKTLLVTSPSPEDGKTTLTSNLAIAFAQAGRRVLLIDSDCRKPRQHKVFGLSNEIGLSSILAGDESIETATQRGPVEHLDVLPCGPLPPNPAEMLNAQSFVDLTEELGRKYDQIIFDSPPILPVADGRIIAALCDTTLLVLKAQRSTRKVAQHARDALTSVGGNVIGVVVNDVARKNGAYGYYSGYSYYYHQYGYGEDKEDLAKTKRSRPLLVRGSNASSDGG